MPSIFLKFHLNANFFSMGSKINYGIYIPKIAFTSFKMSLSYLENKLLNILKLIMNKIYG